MGETKEKQRKRKFEKITLVVSQIFRN